MLYVVHIAGRIMIKSGIYGISRGETGERVKQEKEMISFIPLYLNALDRSNGDMRT